MSILMKQEFPKQESKDIPGRKAFFFLNHGTQILTLCHPYFNQR